MKFNYTVFLAVMIIIFVFCLFFSLNAGTTLSKAENNGKSMSTSTITNLSEDEPNKNTFQQMNGIINRQLSLVSLYIQISSWMFAAFLFFIGFFGFKGYQSVTNLKSLQYKTEKKLSQIETEIENARKSVELVKTEAMKQIEQAHLEIDNVLKIVYRLTQGDRYSVEGRYSKAENWYLRALEIRPSIDIYFRLAKFYGDFGHYSKAISIFENKVVKLFANLSNAEKSQTYSLMARNYSKDGKEAEAIKYAKKAIEIDPNNETAIRTLGRNYLNLQNFEKAKECFENALILKPDNLNSRVNYAVAIFCISIIQNDSQKRIVAQKLLLECEGIISKKRIETHEHETSFLLFYEGLILLGIGLLSGERAKFKKMLSYTIKAVEIEQHKRGVIQSFYVRYKLLKEISKSKDRHVDKALKIMDNKLSNCV